MEKYTDHSLRGFASVMLGRIDAKSMAAIAAIELCMLLFAASKGMAASFLPIALLLMGFSVVVCAAATYTGSDMTLPITVLILLDIGFLVQQIQDRESVNTEIYLIKMAVTFTIAFVGIYIYSRVRCRLSCKLILAGMIMLQYILSALMIIFGQVVGDRAEQGAVISLMGITAFEIVKILYLFTAAGLISEEDMKEGSKLPDGEILLLLHTIILTVFLGICNELGTMLIISTIGIMTLWMFGNRRKMINITAIVSAVGFALIWIISDRVLLPAVSNGSVTLPAALIKIISRFGSALHPEMYISGCGYQSIRGLEALTIGGWFGIETERYRMPLPESVNDFIFDNVVQTMGALTGFIVILLFFAFLRKGMLISTQCEDPYFRRLSFIITTMIIIHAVVHIGYNIALFPVTGIPLYFISQGFTAMTTGMLLTGVLMVNYADNNNMEDGYNGF